MNIYVWGNIVVDDLWCVLDEVFDFNLSVMMKVYLE